VLSAGYRYMEFDFKGTRGVADLKLAMNGPFIGVKFKF
jgi:hypothetical protein